MARSGRLRRANKRNGMQRPSILRDVAKEAGVSTATVSRALNSPDRVSEEAVNRVKAAAAKLAYVQNRSARALRNRRTGMIGVVVPTLRHALYARHIEALQEKLREHGYILLVATSEYSLNRECEQVELLVERDIEGLVLLGQRHQPRVVNLVTARNLPVVTTYLYKENPLFPCIGYDHIRAAEQVANYLLDMGHRNFGMIPGKALDMDRVVEKVNGFRLALEARGGRLKQEAVIEAPYVIGAGREAFRALLAKNAGVTAIVCGSDVLAFGVLAECRTAGIKVPDDISVVGFDNLEFAAHLSPELTTVEIPVEEMGRRAAEYLVNRINGDPTLVSLALQTQLVVRGTTGPMLR